MKLTRDEILLVTSLLLALVLGVAIKHFREQHRLSAPPPSAAATPAKPKR